MIELPMVFVAGILGAGHCLGMCGPFALAIGTAAPGWPSAVARQIAFTLGRVFTYGVLGMTAGYGGQRLAQSLPRIVNVPAAIAIAAGVWLVWQGLIATGLVKSRAALAGGSPCLAGGLVGHFLHQKAVSGSLLAGMLTGFLPCGLLYGMLALAVSTGNAVLGAALMIVFGLGTAPGMIVVGVTGRLLGVVTRRRLLAAAAWCLVLTGVISVARGVSYFGAGGAEAGSCPLCAPSP